MKNPFLIFILAYLILTAILASCAGAAEKVDREAVGKVRLRLNYFYSAKAKSPCINCHKDFFGESEEPAVIVGFGYGCTDCHRSK